MKTTQREALLLLHKRYKNAPPTPPPPHKVVISCPLPGEVRHLMWWPTKYFADHVDIFHLYAEMDTDEHVEMQLKFHNSQNPSVFVTTPIVNWTGLNLTAGNHAVIAQTLWVLNKQWHSFA
jgi:hypothetical protein